MASYGGRRAHSPGPRNRRGHTSMDPHRASTGSLPGYVAIGGGSDRDVDRGAPRAMGRMIPGGGFPEGAGRRGDPLGYHYDGPRIHQLHPPPGQPHLQPHITHGGPPPAAPPAPHSGQPSPYGTNPHSPASSSDALDSPYYPNGPAPHHLAYVPAPPQPQPAPVPTAMRGGDGSISRRPTTAGNKPAIHQQQYVDQGDYPDYRSSRPIIHTQQSSSSQRDRSPSEASGPPFMVIPGSGGAVSHPRAYHPGSSGYSDDSFESSSKGQKGYLVSAGADRHRRTNSRDYQLAASENRSRAGMYHIDGPPRRRGREPGREVPRERSLSRPDLRRAQSEDYDYDESPEPPRRFNSGPVPTVGALVRSQSRSDSRGPSSSTGQLVRRRQQQQDDDESDDDASSPADGTIRVEYNGQAIDIKYTGNNGKPMVGNITINTTARTISAPEPQPQQPAQQLLPAPPPPPLALPPNVVPVMIPAPPRPGEGQQQTQQALPAPQQMQALPAPPAPPSRRAPRSSDSDNTDTDYSASPRGPDIYQSMSNLRLEDRERDRESRDSRDPRDREPQPRGRAPAPPPNAAPAPRAPSAPPSARSRSRGPPEEPLWTKISRDIVSKRAVLVRGYEFEEVPGSIIIYRVLDSPEIDDLVDLSEKIRQGKVEVVRRERDLREGRDPREGSSRRRSRSRGGNGRPGSVHGSIGGGSGSMGPMGPMGPGPSKERPPPMKPAIVQRMPEAPSAPSEDGREGHGTYVGYRKRG